MDEWKRLETWWRSNAPDALARLRSPATTESIDAAERAMSVTLPPEYRDWLLDHDGAESGLVGDELLGIDDVVTTWRALTDQFATPVANHIEAAPGVHAAWWHRQWIPITSDGSGNHVCIDLDPVIGGTHGQLVKFWHDGGERPRIAESVSAWFSAHHAGLVSGALVILDDEGRFDGVLPRTSLHGSLAACRIRGESDTDYRARLDHEKQRNRGWVISGLVGTLIRYKLVELRPDAFDVVVIASLCESLATLPWWVLPDRLHRELVKHRDVAQVHVTIEKLREAVDAFPTLRGALGDPPWWNPPPDLD